MVSLWKEENLAPLVSIFHLNSPREIYELIFYQNSFTFCTWKDLLSERADAFFLASCEYGRLCEKFYAGALDFSIFGHASSKN